MEKNEVITLKITAMSSEGSGIGRHEGMAVFVPLTAVGDVAEVKILKVLKTYSYGKLMNLLESSPDRISSACTVFERCGGCAYQHLSYPAELAIKHLRVKDAMERIGGLDIKVNPVVAATTAESYRNKAEYPVGRCKDGETVSGFYARGSHTIIPCERCQIQCESADKIKELVLSFMQTNRISSYDEKTGKGFVRHLFVRTASTGEIMVLLVINGATMPHADKLVTVLTDSMPGIKSIGLNFNTKDTNVIMGEKTVAIYGGDTITDTLLGLKFQIAARSFYQVNHSQCEKMYTLALEKAAVGKDDICLDLYCGVGTITCLLAKHAKKVYGVEIVPEAVDNAKANATLNGLANVEFLCASADEAADRLQKEGVHIDVLTVDPPRKGLEPALIDTIMRIAPKRVVYISCDPATLARDLKLFHERGYSIHEVTPVDMFPKTPHTECVVLMSKIKK